MSVSDVSRSRFPRTVVWVVGIAMLTVSPSWAAKPNGDPPGLKDPNTAPHGDAPGGGEGGPEEAVGAACVQGSAGGFPCSDVDLLSFVPIAELAGEAAATANDIWGWTDPETGREYAIVGLSNGVAFVDVSDPVEPRVLGRLPTRTLSAPWRDVKVYADRAYVVADGVGVHGMQVFDLRRLRGVGSARTFEPDRLYFGAGSGVASGETLGSAHNIAIDEATGFAFVVGSETCRGGLHMVDLSKPGRPKFAGCFADDGYTHDAQCLVYRGPDGEHRGDEICFAYNEDTLTIVDVEDKAHPRELSRTAIAGTAYVHQGWLTEDHRYALIDDELDEQRFGGGSRTYLYDVSDLESPRRIGVYEAASPSSDHNLYVRGDLAFQANYRSGLRVLDLRRIAEGRLDEVAFFDLVPASDAPGFSGAWSVYPYFGSGTVVVSGIEQGLFVVRPHWESLP